MRDRGARADGDGGDAVEIGEVAGAGVLMQREIPRGPDARGGIDVRGAVDARAEETEEEPAPGVQRPRRETKERGLHDAPGDAGEAIGQGVGAGGGGGGRHEEG